MKVRISDLIVKVIGKNVEKEANSACAIFGYQTPMPDSAKRFKFRKKK